MAKNRSVPRETQPLLPFSKAVAEVQNCGFIKDAEQVGKDVYAATVSNHGYAAVAREIAQYLPGQVRPLKQSQGLVWTNGRHGTVGTIVDYSAYQKVKEARELCFDLYGFEKLPYTIGGCARSLIQYIGEPEPYETRVEQLIQGVPYGYHDCTPGKYINPVKKWLKGPNLKNLFDTPIQNLINPDYKPLVRMYDVQSYYYEMLRRLSSLRVSVYPSSIRLPPMSTNENRRFKEVLDLVADNKTLRNSLAGACAGSIKKGIAYCRDKENGGVKRISPKGTPGPFRAAGLLLVRTGVELCYLESLTVDAVYSTIDSVVTVNDAKPQIWTKHGFPLGIKAEGNAQICHRGSYAIGVVQTVHYKNGEHDEESVQRVYKPSVFYHKSWL